MIPLSTEHNLSVFSAQLSKKCAIQVSTLTFIFTSSSISVEYRQVAFRPFFVKLRTKYFPAYLLRAEPVQSQYIQCQYSAQHRVCTCAISLYSYLQIQLIHVDLNKFVHNNNFKLCRKLFVSRMLIGALQQWTPYVNNF